jgi:hypothetical protein
MDHPGLFTMKWIQTLCSFIALVTVIYLGGRWLHEDSAVFWAPILSLIVMVSYLGLLERNRSQFASIAALLQLLGFSSLGTAALFGGDCALGLFRAPSHTLWNECVHDSGGGFLITAGVGGLCIGIVVFGCMQLLFARLIGRIVGMGNTDRNR